MSTWSFLIRTNITSKYRSSRPVEFCEKGVVRNFAKSIKKRLGQSPFFNKAAGQRDFIKKEALAYVFSCEFCKISKNIFFTEHLRWLLLKIK